jgi:PII-like signaling protein
MKTTPHSILKLYASTTDKIGSKIFYEYIVHKAKDFGISGVTVYRGIMGYGLSSNISSSKFWELTEKLPVKIEMIDSTSKLEEFYTRIESDLEQMKKGCLAVIEPVMVKMHKSGN